MVSFCAFCVVLFTVAAAFSRKNGALGLPKLKLTAACAHAEMERDRDRERERERKGKAEIKI